jgi:hypothetical protein
MKPTLKLTPWFTNGEKPDHIGVYNVSCQRENQTGDWYSYWNGERFYFFASDVEEAYREYYNGCTGGKSDSFVLIEGSWRGLAEKSEV